jgi:hypothetical protein
MKKAASFEAALSLAADLIRIPGLPGQEGAVAARVREEMEALGLADVRVDAPHKLVGIASGPNGVSYPSRSTDREGSNAPLRSLGCSAALAGCRPVRVLGRRELSGRRAG